MFDNISGHAGTIVDNIRDQILILNMYINFYSIFFLLGLSFY